MGDANGQQGGSSSPPSVRRTAAAERQRRAVELRRAGLTFEAIAARLGYANGGGAHKAVMAALSRWGVGGVADLRQLEDDRLDALLRAGLATGRGRRARRD